PYGEGRLELEASGPLVRQERPLAAERRALLHRQPTEPERDEQQGGRRQPPGPAPGGGAAGVVEHPIAVEGAGGGPPGGQATLERRQVGFAVGDVGFHGDSSLSCSRASPAW